MRNGHRSPGRQQDERDAGGQQAGSNQQQRGTAQAPNRDAAASGGATTNYRIVYSSDDSLSDGELHIDRREGSISAWYQRGAAAASGAQAPRRRGAAANPGSTSSGDEEEEGEGAAAGQQQLRSSVTVVVHDHAGADGCGEDASGEHDGKREEGAVVAVSPGELQDMVSWETNNLFDYLKGLCQQQQGQRAGEEGQPGGHDFDRWVGRQEGG
jgi:hypothetical protein